MITLSTPEGKAFQALLNARSEQGQGPVGLAGNAHISRDNARDMLKKFSRLDLVEPSDNQLGAQQGYLLRRGLGSGSATTSMVRAALQKFDEPEGGVRVITKTLFTEQELSGVKKLVKAKLAELVIITSHDGLSADGYILTHAGREVAKLIQDSRPPVYHSDEM